MERIIELSDMDWDENTTELEEFELLSLLIKNYEDKKYPTVKTDPVRAIKFVMEQNNLSPKDMTPYLGSVSEVSKILNYKRPLDLTMIRKLHNQLGIPLSLLIEEYPIESARNTTIQIIKELFYPATNYKFHVNIG